MRSLFRFAGIVVAFLLTIHFVPGVTAPGGWLSILLVALVWSAVSFLIKPVLHILTLPLTVITFGLFALVVNALLFWLTAAFVPGFVVDGFWSAFVGAVALSILTWLINFVTAD